MCEVPETTGRKLNRSIWIGVVAFAVLGALLRITMAWLEYPMTGDPVFSYSYRALLIANGDLSGVYLMWHPPGYPLVLGTLTWLTGRVISAYTWGVLLSAGSSAALVLAIDRLLVGRVVWQPTRLVAASFLALYEGLLFVGSGPLTEPVYILLLYLAVVVADQKTLHPRHGFVVGLLIGFASTVRMEGIAVFLGMLLYIVIISHSSDRTGTGISQTVRMVAASVLGFAITAGWFLISTDYVERVMSGAPASFTIPTVGSAGGQLLRLVRAIYYAFVNWLPYVLLLPYWLLLSLGMVGRIREPHMRRLNGLLLAIVIPSAIAVMLTIMHKRTGTFLLPAAAVWLALGVETVIASLRSDTAKARRWAVVGTAIALNITQALRVPHRYFEESPRQQPVTFVQARMLIESGAAPGCVWAFGSEPELYYFWNVPIRYPYFQRSRIYNPLYANHRGHPEEFIEALRRASFSYLTFVLQANELDRDTNTVAPQVYDRYAGTPLRADLLALAAQPNGFGLRLIDSAPVEPPWGAAYLFQIKTHESDRGRGMSTSSKHRSCWIQNPDPQRP